MRMPYTEALLNSTPRIANPSHTRLSAIDGRPPDLLAPAAGLPLLAALPLREGQVPRRRSRRWSRTPATRATATPAGTRDGDDAGRPRPTPG